MTIGEILKEKRTENQLTQEQLSEMIFVSRKTISNWETGKTTPDIDSLIRLANLFSLSLNNLLLEGSDVVENIKKEKEIKTLKTIKIQSNILSLLLVLFLIFNWNTLTLMNSFILCIISLCNYLISMYLEYIFKLKNAIAIRSSSTADNGKKKSLLLKIIALLLGQPYALVLKKKNKFQ